jgi:hypothetical protein
MSTGDRVVSFRVSATPGVEVPLGPVHAGQGLVLRDFTSNAVLLGEFEMSRLRLAVLASGSVIVEIPPQFERDNAGRMSGWFNSHFAVGVLIRGGEGVSLRLDAPEPMTVNVSALVPADLLV